MIEESEIITMANGLSLSPDTVEKDYVLSWLLWGINSHTAFFELYAITCRWSHTAPPDTQRPYSSAATGFRQWHISQVASNTGVMAQCRCVVSRGKNQRSQYPSRHC